MRHDGTPPPIGPTGPTGPAAPVPPGKDCGLPGPGRVSEHPVTVDAALKTAVEVLERELTLLWRREQVMSRRTSGQTSGRVSGEIRAGLEPTVYGLLNILRREGPLRLTDIAAFLEVGKPSLSRQITVLEHLGLVRRQTDPLDARARTITLTGSGISRLESVQGARARAFQKLLAGWDIEDLTALTDLMSRLNSTHIRGKPSLHT
ncbi:MarR family transcriptional regulator [Vibrio cholerae]|nr:MarR family transcriptional regulator [Vibrio cholerae]